MKYQANTSCDHVRNSHDHSVLKSIDITRRNLMLITKYLWRCASDVFAKLEGSTIITILQLVFGHPVAVAILPLGRYPCN